MHILDLPQMVLFGQNIWVSFNAYLCITLFVVARFCPTAVFWDAHCFRVFVLWHRLLVHTLLRRLSASQLLSPPMLVCAHTVSPCSSSAEQISLFVLLASLIQFVSVCYSWQCLCSQHCVEPLSVPDMLYRAAYKTFVLIYVKHTTDESVVIW